MPDEMEISDQDLQELFEKTIDASYPCKCWESEQKWRDDMPGVVLLLIKRVDELNRKIDNNYYMQRSAIESVERQQRKGC